MPNTVTKIFMGLAAALATALALDALVKDTIGISGHSIVVGSLVCGVSSGNFGVRQHHAA